MKKIIAAILICTLVITALYLCGAFIALSFNPAKWDEIGRMFFCVLSLMAIAYTTGITSEI